MADTGGNFFSDIVAVKFPPASASGIIKPCITISGMIPAAPTADIVNGKPIKAVVQLPNSHLRVRSRHGEPGLSSNVPFASTRRRALADGRSDQKRRSVIKYDDLIDFTPALRGALRCQTMKIGPCSSGPRRYGTVQLPGLWRRRLAETALSIPESLCSRSPLRRRYRQGDCATDLITCGRPRPRGAAGLPLKPPYGRVTAIDLNKGDISDRTMAAEKPSCSNR
jgi:quinoprotein glucose dehydrogenase